MRCCLFEAVVAGKEMNLLKRLFFTLTSLLILTFLFGCLGDAEYGTVDRHGEIIDVDRSSNRILVNDLEQGRIWVDLSDIDDPGRFHSPLEVNVWLDGPVLESDPAQGKAKKVEVIK